MRGHDGRAVDSAALVGVDPAVAVGFAVALGPVRVPEADGPGGDVLALYEFLHQSPFQICRW